MNSKILFSIFTAGLLLPVISFAQDLDEEELEAPEQERYLTYGEFGLSSQFLDQDTNSSKFNEYKDDETDLYVDKLYFGFDDTETGRYFDFRGRRLSRDDQELNVKYGAFNNGSDSVKGWSIDFDWNETPHLLSNSAKTPYDYLGNGNYQVASGIVDDIQIFNVGSAATWTAANAGPGGVGEDARIASVLSNAVHNIDLGTQRETGTLGFTRYFSERTNARFEIKQDTKDGNIVTGVAIGDRPPRSLVVQLPEPIDYNTTDFTLAVEHVNTNYQVDASLTFSKFENDADQMNWNSLFHTANFNCVGIPACAGAADYDRIRYNNNLLTLRSTEYASTGTMTLSPDNTYQNFNINGSVKLPGASRLSASIVYTKMEQDEILVPYSSSSFSGTLDALPRTSADAAIDTTMFNITYNVNPMRGLNLNIHYRNYEMNNDTPQDVWIGTTQDSSAYNYRSERINTPYDLQQDNFGFDLSYYLGKAGTLKFAYENEQIERPHREVAETDEDIFKISYRVKPANWATLRAKYTKADRGGSAYNSEITDQSYAYDTVANAGQFDNPILGFANNPGLRKFDVTDRKRDKLEFSVSLQPSAGLNVNLSFAQIENNYDSDIASSINTWDAILLTFADVFVDPTQLGLLEDETNRYALEVNYSPSDALSIFGYYSKDVLDQQQRGRYMNENNRIDNITGTKDWQATDGSDIWNASMSDETDTIGLGMNFSAKEERLKLNADYSNSNGNVGIDYSTGFRLAEDDTSSFHNHAEWSSPEDVEFETNTFIFALSYDVTEKMTYGLKYIYETYSVKDWQQTGNSAHKLVLSDNFITEIDGETAGTSNDRAGSRLVTLDNVLAPDYDVQMIILTTAYKFD